MNKYLNKMSNYYKQECEYYWIGDEATASNDIRQTIDEVLRSSKIQKNQKARTVIEELIELYNYAIIVRFSKKSINIYKNAITTICNRAKKEGFI